MSRVTTFVAVCMLLLLNACGKSGSHEPAMGITLPTQSTLTENLQHTGWPVGLPEDVAQPWEEFDEEGQVIPAIRSASGINPSSELTIGAARFGSGGDVTDNGDASRLTSVPGGSAWALYRIPLGGEQPGVVSVDANPLAGEDYYVGISRYGADRWDWHGPFTDNHVRISTAEPGPWTSALGNLFVTVLVHGGAAADVVGIGTDALDVIDGTAPGQPTGLSATPLAASLLLSWDAVVATDLAGYRIYHSDRPFISGSSAGVRQVDSLEGLTEHQLMLNSDGPRYMRVSAVDISGNESPLSEPISESPLAGEMPGLAISLTKPSASLNESVTLTATGGELYDFDTDGDGILDIIGSSSGTIQVQTSALGIIRPRVRVGSTGSMAVAHGSVSLIISGNSRPVAVANSDVSAGFAPLAVTFSGTESTDFDGMVVGGGWDFDGDGTYDVWDDTDIVHVLSAEHTYTAPGTYNAKLRVVDDGGTWDVDTLTISVGGLNALPTAILQVDNLSGDAPLTVGFSAFGSVDSDGTIVEFAWDWEGDGLYDAVGEGTLASHTYTEPGIYNARLRVEDNAGGRDTITAEITVNTAGNDLPLANLASDRVTDYAPFSIEFDASGSSDPDGSIELYEWDFDGDGNYEEYGTAATANHTYPVRGWYSAGLRVTDNVGAQATAELDITLPSEWSGFSGPAQNRRSPYVGAQTSDIKWTQTTGNNGPSSPAIGPDGTVYIGSSNNNLYALRSSDGVIKWTFSTGGTVASSPTIADDGTIYVGSNDNELYAINPDGTEKWAVDIDGFDVGAPPTVGPDGAIYASAGFGTLVALNPDGSIRWERAATGFATNAAVALAPDGTIYFCDVGSNGLRAINPDGSNKWLASIGIGSTSSAPAVGEDGTVYVGAGDGQLYAINPDGTQKWTYDLMTFIVSSSPAIASDGTVYIGHNDNRLYAINPDGSFKWSYETGDNISTSSPAIGADGTIYVGSEDDSLYAITPAGSLLWSAATGGNVNSSPAIGRDGTVYVGCNDSEFYAFGN